MSLLNNFLQRNAEKEYIIEGDCPDCDEEVKCEEHRGPETYFG